MSGRRFLCIVLTGAAGWWLLFACAIILVDPYGVSPLAFARPGFNAEKPKRRDIDRLIKPYEVWLRQPRTVFLGTSRIHQGLDPAALDGTRFAPAYNAAVPGNILVEDVGRIRQYVALDKNLKIVISELFLWNFIYRQPPEPDHSIAQVIPDAMALNASLQAFGDSLATVKANVVKERGAHIGPRGNWVKAQPFEPTLNFEAKRFADSVMKIHSEWRDMALQPSAFAALDRMVELCKENGLELYLLIMPHHPYDDYRIRSFGYWPLLEQWYRRLSSYPNVLSASRYSAQMTEPISEHMRYWNDPLHPNVRFGDLILRSFAARQQNAASQDQMVVPVTRDTVEGLLAEKRADLDRWIEAHRLFAETFERAKLASGLTAQR